MDLGTTFMSTPLLIAPATPTPFSFPLNFEVAASPPIVCLCFSVGEPGATQRSRAIIHYLPSSPWASVVFLGSILTAPLVCDCVCMYVRECERAFSLVLSRIDPVHALGCSFILLYAILCLVFFFFATRHIGSAKVLKKDSDSSCMVQC